MNQEIINRLAVITEERTGDHKRPDGNRPKRYTEGQEDAATAERCRAR